MEEIEEFKEQVEIVADPLIPVRVVMSEGGWVLVEEVRSLRRVSVPVIVLVSTGSTSGVCESALKDGIPFGLAWEEISLPVVDAPILAYQLRRHGLQTAQDILNNPKQVERALREAYAPLIETILKFAKFVNK